MSHLLPWGRQKIYLTKVVCDTYDHANKLMIKPSQKQKDIAYKIAHKIKIKK